MDALGDCFPGQALEGASFGSLPAEGGQHESLGVGTQSCGWASLSRGLTPLTPKVPTCKL